MFAFDLVRTVEPLGDPNPDPVGLPGSGADADRYAGRVRSSAAHDHGGRPRHADDDDRRRVIRAGKETSRRSAGGPALPVARPARRRRTTAGGAQFSRICARAVRVDRRRIVEYIYAGDAYQVVPSQRWSAPVPVERIQHLSRAAGRQPEPVHVFPGLRRLRDRRCQPGAAGDCQGRRVATRPVAGTRPREQPSRRTQRTPRGCSPIPRSAPST